VTVFLWLLAACSQPDPVAITPAPAGQFQLVYTADVHGEIEPCG
jgi:hypothetical protein